MYHYSKHGNTVLKDGLFGIRKSGRSLALYAHRAQTEEPEKIVWQGNDKALKSIVDGCDLFSFELEQLVQDGIVTAIWCKNGSDAGGYNEKFKKIGLGGIDYSPLTWEKCDSSKDLLFAVVRHYMLVLKDGVIPPRYLQKEN